MTDCRPLDEDMIVFKTPIWPTLDEDTLVFYFKNYTTD